MTDSNNEVVVEHPLESQAAAEMDGRREMIVRQHFPADEQFGKAMQDAEYTRRTLGLTEDELAGDKRTWDQRLIEDAGHAAGLRATSGMTPAEADEERRRLIRTPGYLKRIEQDPAEKARWQGLVLRAGRLR